MRLVPMLSILGGEALDTAAGSSPGWDSSKCLITSARLTCTSSAKGSRSMAHGSRYFRCKASS